MAFNPSAGPDWPAKERKAVGYPHARPSGVVQAVRPGPGRARLLRGSTPAMVKPMKLAPRTAVSLLVVGLLGTAAWADCKIDNKDDKDYKVTYKHVGSSSST